jgi:hypothetical protein
MNIRFTDSSTGTTENDGILFGKDNINNAFIRNLENRDIYFGAGNDANATERMRIQASSGYIGIGTTNPLSNLDIRGNLILPNDGSRIGIGTTNAQSNLHVIGDVGIHGSLNLNNKPLSGISDLNTSNLNSSGTIIANNITISGSFTNTTTGVFKTSQWSNVITNPNNIYYSIGSVGINIQNPTEKLEVDGNIKLYNDDISGIKRLLRNDGTEIAQWSLNNNNVSILNNVGIGTVNTTSILHINSNLSGCNMNIRFTDSSTGTTENDGILFGKDSNNNAFIRNLENRDIYFGAGNDANATERMRIQASSGFIGIGTTNPTVALDILNGTLKTSNIRTDLIQNLSGTASILTVTGNNATLALGTGNITSTGSISANNFILNGQSIVNAWNKEALNTNAIYYSNTINDNRVGIGTTLSVSILHLHSNLSGCNMNIRFTDNSTGTTENDGILFGKDNINNAFIRNLENRDIYFGAGNNCNATERMRIQASSGFIGIGTTNPSSALDIRGDITINGFIKNIDGSYYASSKWSNADVKNNIFYNIGAVGIGTSVVLTTPSDTKLSVAGTITCDKIRVGNAELTGAMISGTGSTNANNITSGILAVSYGGTGCNILNKNQLIVGNGIEPVIQSPNLIWNNSCNIFIIQGNVGIGTTNPLSNLDIRGNLILPNDGSRIGIGTTNAQSNLHVIGDVGIHGSLNLNNKPLTGISDLNTSNLNSSGTIIANNITISGSFTNTTTGVFKTSQWSNVITNPDNIYYSIGSVGINIQNPTEKLEVDGNIKLYNDDILGIKKLLRNDGTEIAQWSLNNNNVSILNNVGIGTVNTTSILHLNSNLSGCNMNIRFTDSSTGTTENDGILFGKDSNNNAFIRNLENRDIYFGAGNDANATERMRIQASSGFIGIGTTNPLNNLDIRGNLILPNDGSKIGIGTTNPLNNLDIRGNLILPNDGSKIGIGTTNPTVALDILNGTLKTSNIRTDLIQNLSGTASILSITGNNATLALGTGNITSTGSISANNFILNGQSIVNAWNKEALNTNAIYYSNTINDNRVGIGTTVSISILHLHSNLSGCNMNIRFTDSSTGTTENDGILFGKDNINNAFIRNLENRDIYFGAGDNCNATERIRIQASSGFIGIGTTNPLSNLDIRGNLILPNDGNRIGIGTTNPTVALDILNGTLKTSNIRTDLIQNLNGTASILTVTGNNATLALGTGNISSTGSISANNFILNGQSIVNAWNKEALNTNAIYYSNTINDNRVGIGTTVSVSILHLHSNLSGCNMNIRFTDSSTGTTENDGILFGKDNINNAFIRNLENRDIYFGAGNDANATERMRIQASSGFIGIGTTNPTVALDILNGTLKTSNIRTDLIQNLNGTASILSVTGNNATLALGILLALEVFQLIILFLMVNLLLMLGIKKL